MTMNKIGSPPSPPPRLDGGGSLGLPDKILADIVSVLQANPKVHKAVVFGSRAKGTNKPYSDIDIALWGDFDSLEPEQVALDLDELPTVYKFDVVSYEKIRNDALKEHINRVGVTIYSAHRPAIEAV